MMDQKGFSLTELLVGMVIGAIVILMVGALSQVGTVSVNTLRNESSVEDDAYYALDMIQHAVRESASAPVTGSTLTANKKTFRVSSRTLNGATVYDLVYDDASTSPATTHTVIFGMDGLTFTSSLTGNEVTVNLTVSKKVRATDAQPTVFPFTVKVTRRNP